MRRFALLPLVALLGCDDGLVFTSGNAEPTEPADMGTDVPIELIGHEDPSEDDPPPSDGTPPLDCESDVEAEQRRLTNEARAENGTAPLACDTLMAQVARAHAQDMCDNNYFSHDSQDGRRFSNRLRDAGVSFRAGAENIASGQRTAASVHNSWFNSPGHQRNLLNGAYARIGVGFVQCAERGTRWVQVFAD